MDTNCLDARRRQPIASLGGLRPLAGQPTAPDLPPIAPDVPPAASVQAEGGCERGGLWRQDLASYRRHLGEPPAGLCGRVRERWVAAHMTGPAAGESGAKKFEAIFAGHVQPLYEGLAKFFRGHGTGPRRRPGGRGEDVRLMCVDHRRGRRPAGCGGLAGGPRPATAGHLSPG